MDDEPDAAPGAAAGVRRAPSWLLGRASSRAHALLVEHLGEAGVRPHHYRLLAALEERGDSSQAELGRATWIDRSDVVAAMRELEVTGLVTRAPDPAHGRRNVVSLTPAGRARMPVLHAALAAAQEAILGPLTPPEQRELVRLLSRLTAGDPQA